MHSTDIQVGLSQHPDFDKIYSLFYRTIHSVNAADYSKIQLDTWASDPRTPEEWASSFDDHIVCTAQSGNALAGFADMATFGHIFRFYVSKDYLRRHVGTRMLEFLVKEAKKLGVTKLTAEVSITAEPFFSHFGFVTVRVQNKPLEGVVFKNYWMEYEI